MKKMISISCVLMSTAAVCFAQGGGTIGSDSLRSSNPALSMVRKETKAKKVDYCAVELCSGKGKLAPLYRKAAVQGFLSGIKTVGATVFNGMHGVCEDVDTSPDQSTGNCGFLRGDGINFVYAGMYFYQDLWRVTRELGGHCLINPHVYDTALKYGSGGDMFPTYDVYTGQRRDVTYGELEAGMVAALGSQLCQ